MSIAAKLKEFLDKNRVSYQILTHRTAFTAQETAATLHVPGKEVAKTVVVRLDDKPALAVLPASLRINFRELEQAAGAKRSQLLSEADFQQLFPDCELGAMPPLGNLYGLAVFADDSLAKDEEIVFNAGTHAEAIRMRYADFAKLANAKVAHFAERL